MGDRCYIWITEIRPLGADPVSRLGAPPVVTDGPSYPCSQTSTAGRMAAAVEILYLSDLYVASERLSIPSVGSLRRWSRFGLRLLLGSHKRLGANRARERTLAVLFASWKVVVRGERETAAAAPAGLSNDVLSDGQRNCSR